MLRPGSPRQFIGMLFTPGFPGYTRGVAACGPGAFVVTTALGAVSRFWPGELKSEVLASGFDQLYGVAIAPGGAAIVAEQGTGRVLSIEGGEVEEIGSGLKLPSGVAVSSDGTRFVAESGGGRVVKLSAGKAQTVLDGLKQPQGILVRGSVLYVVDAGAKALIQYELTTGKRSTIASDLPVGAPPGVAPKFLKAIGDLSGPMGPFAGITAGPDGALYFSADAEGSVMRISPA